MKWLIAHWGENKKHVFDGVTESLRGLGHECTFLPRNDMSRRDELIDAIGSGRYDRLLTWQRFYPMQTDLIEAVARSTIRTVYMDYGFVPHYESVVFDAEGDNATSGLRAAWAAGDDMEVGDGFVSRAEALLVQESGRARLVRPPDIREIPYLRSPFVFVPLQRQEDSVIRYDSDVHDFGALVRRVLTLAHGRCYVVAKTHPLDREVDLGVPESLADSHCVIRTGSGADNEALCDFLLSRAALVVGINSNMLFRAIVLGTPVIATGRGWFTGSGVVTEVDGVDRLHTFQTTRPGLELQVRYVAACLSRQLHFNELNNPARFQEALERVGVSGERRRMEA